jgi:small-conductance mechanosensitive channel
MRQKRSVVPLVVSLVILMVATGLSVYWQNLPSMFESELLAKIPSEIRYVFGTIAWLALARCFNLLTQDIVFEGYYPWRRGRSVPGLLQTVAAGLVYFVAALAIISVVFDMSPMFLITATGGAGIVVGFALQTVIADFFAGLILTVQRPFSLGDYVTVDNQEGVVADINWRATMLLDSKKQVVTIPNSRVTNASIVNTTHSGPFQQGVSVTIGHDVPVGEAIEVLRKASTEVSGEGSRGEVVTEKLDEDGVTYRVSYTVPSLARWRDLDRDMIAAIQRHLTGIGLQPAAKGLWAKEKT